MLTCCRVGGTGIAGDAIAPPIFLEIRKKVAFSTPNISRLQELHAAKVISTPNILHLPPPLSTSFVIVVPVSLQMFTTNYRLR